MSPENCIGLAESYVKVDYEYNSQERMAFSDGAMPFGDGAVPLSQQDLFQFFIFRAGWSVLPVSSEAVLSGQALRLSASRDWVFVFAAHQY